MNPSRSHLPKWLQSALGAFWYVAGSASIRVKVLGIVLGVIILLGIFVIFQINQILETVLLEELTLQGADISENMAAALSTMGEASPDEIERYLSDRRVHFSNASHNTHLEFAALISPEGAIIFDSVTEGVTVPSLSTLPPGTISGHGLFNVGRQLLVFTPIEGTPNYLALGFGTQIYAEFATRVTLQLFSLTLIMVAVGFAAAFLLTWILTRPILELVKATNAVINHDYSIRVERWANDEIGELSTAFNTMIADLEQAEKDRQERERMREQYLSGVILAQENERQRVARDLHDSVSQSLTSLLVGIQNIKSAPDTAAIQQQADELREVVAQTLDETRNLAWQLRPGMMGDQGLIPALEHYVQDFRARFDLPVDFVVQGLPSRLQPEIETSLYRIVQEGLTNIARYAKASAASVLLAYRNNMLRVIIEDNGIGFDVEKTRKEKQSLGLKGISERAGLIGGTLTIESSPGQGTSLFIEIPYTPKEVEQSQNA